MHGMIMRNTMYEPFVMSENYNAFSKQAKQTGVNVKAKQLNMM